MVSLEEAIQNYKLLSRNHYLIETARSIGISFGD
jgi:hypothetical protein